jgi:hypothetical protein
VRHARHPVKIAARDLVVATEMCRISSACNSDKDFDVYVLCILCCFGKPLFVQIGLLDEREHFGDLLQRLVGSI